MKLIFCLIAVTELTGCAISNHGVFPKPVWYWSADAVEQRRLDKERKAGPSNDWQKDLQKAVDEQKEKGN